jgi:hypothetical protein
VNTGDDRTVTAVLAERLEHVGLRERVGALLSCTAEDSCHLSTCPRCAPRLAKRECADLVARVRALPPGRLRYIAARVAGDDPAAATRFALRMLAGLRERRAWRRAVEGGVARVHVDPEGAEVRALLVLRGGIEAVVESEVLLADDLRRAWRAAGGGHLRCERPAKLDSIAKHVTERVFRPLLGAPSAWFERWARWAPGARLTVRLGAWHGASRIGGWLPGDRRIASGRSEDGLRIRGDLESGGLRADQRDDGRPSSTSDRSSREDDLAPPPPPPAEGPTPQRRAAPLPRAGAVAAPRPKDVIARLLAEGRRDVPTVLHVLGEVFPARRAWAVEGAVIELYRRDEGDLAVALDDAAKATPAPAAAPIAPAIAVVAEAAHVLRIRKGDLVSIKRNREVRFTRHGAYPIADLRGMTVASVHGEEAEILSARGERLGRLPLAHLVQAGSPEAA